MECWNEEQIKTRANQLFELALKIWQVPHLEDEILNIYKSKNQTTKEYQLDSYKIKEKTKSLCETLSREILALDENITQHFTKLYIAYKLNTNILDIVVLKNELKLYLNINLYELQDSQKLARDVSNIGSWGVGNTEIRLKSQSQIPYCLGLIKQALERQLGE